MIYQQQFKGFYFSKQPARLKNVQIANKGINGLSNFKHYLYCQKYFPICLHTHMNLSDISFLIHGV